MLLLFLLISQSGTFNPADSDLSQDDPIRIACLQESDVVNCISQILKLYFSNSTLVFLQNVFLIWSDQAVSEGHCSAALLTDQ